MKLEDVKVGQRVISVFDDESRGWIGTVRCTDTPYLGIQFDGLKCGHDLAERLVPVGSTEGWWLRPDEIELLHKQEIPLNGNLLPVDATKRKEIPIGTGVLDYFPAALAEVAKVSFEGNKQHNANEELHWARGKSTDQFDTMVRHSLERGTFDADGQRHSAKMAWRALAILQLELEAEGAPVARGAK